MTNLLKNIGIILASVVISVSVMAMQAPKEEVTGGVYNQVTQEFREGLKAGTSNQFQVANDGDLSTTGTVAIGTSSATSSVNFGRACWTVTRAGGSQLFVWFTAQGALATSTSSCL